jgi:hypothetical protein
MLGLSGGNRGVKPETRSRLQLRRLKQEKRQLRQSLRNREIAYRTYALRVKSINQQIAGANKQLAEQTESAWRSAFESLGGFVKSVVKKMIAELASAAIMATMLAAITGGTSLSIGGMSGFGNFSGLFTKGLTGFAEGGVVTGPTPAMVGEYPGAASNPEIITPESKMRSIVEGALGGQRTEIVVRGETRTDGRDLVTTYNQTERLQRRKGRR